MSFFKDGAGNSSTNMIIPFSGKIPKIDRTAFIADNAAIVGDVEIGPEANIWFQSIVHGDTNYIRISAQCNIQDACVLYPEFPAYCNEAGGITPSFS